MKQNKDRRFGWMEKIGYGPGEFRRLVTVFLVANLSVGSATARERVALPPELSAYSIDPAPEPVGLQFRKGDRLAICGDSITEQKRYSVIIETYLTACMPELEITCRQYGWSGEQAGGFLKRLRNDVLRFSPTIATTCYGMNDFRYVPFDEGIAAEYRRNLTAISSEFRGSGCRLIIGSPGIIDAVPSWVESARGSKQDLNHALSRFRNVALEVARAESGGFADVYLPMLLADHQAKAQHGPDFMVAGDDGVHPNWAGQLIMAHAFLKAMGLDGDLGRITWDAAEDSATAANGHEVVSCSKGAIQVKSSRYPFSPDSGAIDRDDSIRAGMALVPFDESLNRLTLRITHPKSSFYQVRWGKMERRYSSEDLAAGVSLAADFADHPLTPAFRAVWDAVLAKQQYETRQIKMLVHGPEGAADLDATFALTEKARAPLAEVVRTSVRPVEHTLHITPVD